MSCSVDRLEHAADLVVAVRADAQHLQRPVDLRRRDEPQRAVIAAGLCDPRARDRCPVVERRAPAAAASTSMPARRITSSITSCFTCIPNERLFRSCLRGLPKPARTMRKNTSSGTSTRGRGSDIDAHDRRLYLRRRARTRRARACITMRASAVHLRRDAEQCHVRRRARRSTPPPRAAPSPRAAAAASRLEEVADDRRRDVIRQVRDDDVRRHRAGPRRAARPARARARPPRRSRRSTDGEALAQRSTTRSRSTSTATTRHATLGEDVRERAAPGPHFEHARRRVSVDAASTMRFRMLVSERKCWPKRFFAGGRWRAPLREDRGCRPTSAASQLPLRPG